MKNIGIYIHIPFCQQKCKYCNFISFCEPNQIKEYFLALKKEIEQSSREYSKYGIDTIYIGGGTPSLLNEEYILDILTLIKSKYHVNPDAEISIEANPNSVTLNKARVWHDAGINRVSVGLQSANNKQLKLLGRIHNRADYINAINWLKEAGFTNINTDIMLGIMKQTKHTLASSLRLATQHSTHVSAYSLILEENTPLYKEVLNKQTKLPHEEKVIKFYDFAVKYLHKHGFDRYEVSNFCKDGYMCKHNYNCWSYHEYIGFGVAAHTYIDGKRYNNVETLVEYIDKIRHNQSVRVDMYDLSREEMLEEYIMLGMRKTEGISIKYLKNKFAYNILKEKKKQISRLSGLGLIRVDDNSIKATDQGFYVLNKIILELA